MDVTHVEVRCYEDAADTVARLYTVDLRLFLYQENVTILIMVVSFIFCIIRHFLKASPWKYYSNIKLVGGTEKVEDGWFKIISVW